MPPLRRVSVVYADDNPRYRTSLTRALLEHPQLDLAAVVVDGQSALAAIEHHTPDVALVDVRIPGLSGLDIAEALQAKEPALPTRVLLLASIPVQSSRRVMDAVGLRGVMDKSLSRERICDAVARLGAGLPLGG